MQRRSPGAGNARELKVMALLASEGWLCGSRRHIGGAGDILAVRQLEGYYIATPEALLIEVKATAEIPWRSTFGPADRQAMVETAKKYAADPWLYWWPPRGKLQRIHASDWPIRKLQAQGVVEP